MVKEIRKKILRNRNRNPWKTLTGNYKKIPRKKKTSWHIRVRIFERISKGLSEGTPNGPSGGIPEWITEECKYSKLLKKSLDQSLGITQLEISERLIKIIPEEIAQKKIPNQLSQRELQKRLFIE